MKDKKLDELIEFLGEMQGKLKKLTEDLNREPRELALYFDGTRWMECVGNPDMYSAFVIMHVREIL